MGAVRQTDEKARDFLMPEIRGYRRPKRDTILTFAILAICGITMALIIGAVLRKVSEGAQPPTVTPSPQAVATPFVVFNTPTITPTVTPQPTAPDMADILRRVQEQAALATAAGIQFQATQAAAGTATVFRITEYHETVSAAKTQDAQNWRGTQTQGALSLTETAYTYRKATATAEIQSTLLAVQIKATQSAIKAEIEGKHARARLDMLWAVVFLCGMIGLIVWGIGFVFWAKKGKDN